MKRSILNKRMLDILYAGLSGYKPKVSLRLDKLEEIARQYIQKGAFAYISGGGGREDVVNKNHQEFLKWAIIPQVLMDVSVCDTSTVLFGKKHEHPFILSPIGAIDVANPDAEPAVGRAAKAEDIAMAFSSQASTPMEKVASQMGDSARWYQIYVTSSEEFNLSLIRRAEACGCSALLVTVDTKTMGWRTADLDLGYSLANTYSGVAQYTSDPVFQTLLDEYISSLKNDPLPKITLKLIRTVIQMTWYAPGNFFSNLISRRHAHALALVQQLMAAPYLKWEDIVQLKKQTKLPVIVKGILDPGDAQKAIDHGLDGIIVSNHGGRQLSSCITAIEALPAIVDVVKGKIPILMDSGIRGGADVFKAIALGANAVLIGRPYLYGLAIAGEEGVREVIQNVKAEFEITMTLSGCTSISDITRDKLLRVN